MSNKNLNTQTHLIKETLCKKLKEQVRGQEKGWGLCPKNHIENMTYSGYKSQF